MSHIRVLMEADPGEVEQMIFDLRKNVTPRFLVAMPIMLDFRVYEEDEEKFLKYFAQYAYLDDTTAPMFQTDNGKLRLPITSNIRLMKLFAWIIRELILFPFRLFGYKRPYPLPRTCFQYDRKLHQCIVIGVKKDKKGIDRELFKQTGKIREVEFR